MGVNIWANLRFRRVSAAQNSARRVHLIQISAGTQVMTDNPFTKSIKGLDMLLEYSEDVATLKKVGLTVVLLTVMTLGLITVAVFLS